VFSPQPVAGVPQPGGEFVNLWVARNAWDIFGDGADLLGVRFGFIGERVGGGGIRWTTGKDSVQPSSEVYKCGLSIDGGFRSQENGPTDHYI